MFRSACITLCVAFLCACNDGTTNNGMQTPSPQTPGVNKADNRWVRQQWIEKLANRLRYGKPLDARDKIEDLLKLSDEDIVATFMRSPEFADTVLDFNMYTLGFNVPNLHTQRDGTYASYVFAQPNAVAAAQEVMKDGNFFKLVEYDQPLYLPPFRQPNRTLPEQQKMTDSQVRQWYKDKIIANLNDIADELNKNTPDINKACNLITGENGYFNTMFMMGFDFLVVESTLFHTEWAGDLFGICTLKVDKLPAGTIDRFKKMAVELPMFVGELNKIADTGYTAKELTSLQSLDNRVNSFVPAMRFMSETLFYTTLVNSSTNFNRKRASYVLKRFFCDDLTPIAVAAPTQHMGNKHVSDPACVACHYKLDPMAGFFRDIGVIGLDFSRSPIIVLDDNVKLDREKYGEEWQNSDGTWNVGYIRSLDDESKNDRGQSLKDLFAIIAKAPEFKSCLVRRVNEYFISDKQTIDAGYMDELTKSFEQEAQKNSAIAFKNLVSKVVRSQAFREDNRNPDQCYDFPAHTDLNGRPPCKVAAVLEKNCVGCHSSMSPRGGLALNSWNKLADGSYNFAHTDRNTKQILTLSETSKRIIERLTTTDEDERMPLGKFISFKDRETLYLWAQEQK